MYIVNHKCIYVELLFQLQNRNSKLFLRGNRTVRLKRTIYFIRVNLDSLLLL